MHVGIVGNGPAAAAVEAALGDVEGATPAAVEADALGDVAVGVVVGTEPAAFEAANRAALEGGTPWLAVQPGRVGGVGVDVAASVAGFAPHAGTGCYDCLGTRVAANQAVETPGSAGSSAGAGGGGGDDATGGDADRRLAGALAGRELATLLAGGESDLLGGVLEVPYARHRFLPVPGCGCGATRENRDRYSVPPREFVDRDLDDALARAERALDDRAGVVHEVGEVESFPAPYYLARLASTDEFSDASAAGEAAGVDAGWDAAFVKALGEALERYSAGVYRSSAFVEAAPADLGAEAVPPEAFVTAPGSPGLESGESIPWVAGWRLADRAPRTLPAEFVHFPPPESRFRPAITTGLGLGNSPVEAVLSGLYEVIERDATMLAWYSTFEPLELSVDDEGFDALARRARGEGLSVTPLLVTQDVDVPVVAAAVHREDAWPRFAVGSGAALDPTSAARSALAEALQNWTELRSMGEDGDAGGSVVEYAAFPPAARAFVDAETTVPAASVGPDDPPAGVAELEAVLDRLGDADLAGYAARLTPRDVEALGFEAVRVVVPAAQPLFVGEPYFGDRARTVPDELGFAPRLDREPHPYP